MHMGTDFDGAKLTDLGDGERVSVTAAGVPVTVLRAFQLETTKRTQRRRFEFRTTDAGALTVTAFEAVPAFTVPELLALDWSALSLRAFELASQAAQRQRRVSEAQQPERTLDDISADLAATRDRAERNLEKSRKARRQVERTPEMLARVTELHASGGIEAVRREYDVSTRTAYNYLSEAIEQAEQGADK